MKRFYSLALELAEKEGYDPLEVVGLLEKSIDNDEGPEPVYALATWYLHGKHVKKDLHRAVQLLELASRSGYPDACYDLAVCYEKGEGLEVDEVRAFHLYVKAALYGDSQAFQEVGRCYYYGVGVDKNLDLADIWLEKAESLGVAG